MKAGSLGRSGCSTGTSSASAASFTGGGTAVERERPCGLSGCVTTATTSKPSPSSASSGGTANSGVPKKTTRTLELARRLRRDLLQVPRLPLPGLLPFGQQQAALHGAEMVEEQHAVEVIDLVLHGPRLEARKLGAVGPPVAVQGFERHAEGALHLAVDIGNRETALFSRLALVRGRDDPRVDEDQGWGIVLADVHHGHAAGDPDLIGGEPHTLGRPHGVQQVVHQFAYRGVDGGHGRRALPQHGRAEQVEHADRHWGLASIDRLRTFAMLVRTTTTRDSPLFTVTSSSFRCTTSPMMPPEVTILSPRCNEASS